MLQSAPEFKELRDLDQAVEREIAQFLDQYLYSGASFDSTERITDHNNQLAGMDIIVSSYPLGLSNAIVDEKSASHYVNCTTLHTFAFELSFFRKDQSNQYTISTEGWLTNPRKKTEYYLLVWPSAKEANIFYYQFNNRKYPYFTKDDITRLDYALVSRERVRKFLLEKGFDEKLLGITMRTIRKNAADQNAPFYKEQFRDLTFSCSAQLRECPVNVLIEKEDIFHMAILSGTISSYTR